MRKFFYLLLSLLSLYGMAQAWSPAAGDGWSLKRSGDEMAVYTRDRAGSSIKEVKLIMTVDASIATINEVLNDASRQPEWVYRCLEGRTLGGDLESGWYYYSRIDMPWPMDDRDVVGKVIGSRQGENYKSTTVAAPKRTPKVDGCVRLTEFEVKTSYRKLSESRTEVTYQLHSEPGGAVPAWLVNMFVDKGPVETMTKLRRIVEE